MSTTIIQNSSDISGIFKPGYEFKVEVYDFDSPEIKAEIAKALREQWEIMERTKVDIEDLENRYCNI